MGGETSGEARQEAATEQSVAPTPRTVAPAPVTFPPTGEGCRASVERAVGGGESCQRGGGASRGAGHARPHRAQLLGTKARQEWSHEKSLGSRE